MREWCVCVPESCGSLEKSQHSSSAEKRKAADVMTVSIGETRKQPQSKAWLTHITTWESIQKPTINCQTLAHWPPSSMLNLLQGEKEAGRGLLVSLWFQGERKHRGVLFHDTKKAPTVGGRSQWCSPAHLQNLAQLMHKGAFWTPILLH